jgi:dihydropteroate synthase
VKKSIPLIAGILNITPDSFSDGGECLSLNNAIQRAQQMKEDGADILDVGAESSGPGSKEVSVDEEWNRLKNILPKLVRLGIPLSVDTWKAEVAQKAIDLGVGMINDITAFRGSPQMFEVLQKSECDIIIMYSKDINARTTLQHKVYGNPLQEIGDFLEERVEQAKAKGIEPKRIILDPGMGHFLSSDPNVSISVVRHLAHLKYRFPEHKILIGTSRKSFLEMFSGKNDPKKRLIPSVVSALVAWRHGAHILRVHDVRETKEALATFRALQDEENNRSE